MQIVSPELLLVTSHHRYYLYEIPALAALDAHSQPRINRAHLIWSSKRPGEPNFGTGFVRRLPCNVTAPCINVVDLCSASVNVLALSTQPEKCQILQQTTGSQLDTLPIVSAMASTHVFWVPLQIKIPNLVSLRVRPYPIPLDRRTPLRRLHNNTDFSTHSLEMTVKSSYEVLDLNWDESGWLCVLVTALRPEDPLIVLLLEFA